MPRQYRISPEVASERGKKGAAARNSPDGYIRVLERTDLTAEQKRRLTALVMTFFGGAEQPGGDAAGGEAA
jgi:hypothetical protein